MNWIRPIPGTARRLEPSPNTRVFEQTDDDVPEPTLAPPEGKSLAEFQAEFREPVRMVPDPFDELAAQEESPQFTLAELLLLMTCAAVGAAGVRWMSPAVFVLGAAFQAFLIICLAAKFGRHSRWIRRVMWGAIVIYIVSAGVAALNSYWE